MRYCVPLGIPHSVLKGRVPEPGESAWSAADVDKALLYQAYESRRCPQCGTHPDEWPADDSDEVPPYMAEPYRCYGCQDMGDVRDRQPTGKGAHGIYVRMARVDTWEDLDAMEQEREVARMIDNTGSRPDDEHGMLG